MFNNNPDNEDDFCESYKSEILNNSSHETDSSLNTILKTLIILLLLAIIAGLSIYGYNYMNQSATNAESSIPPSSIQISDDELKVTLEEPEEVAVKKEETVVHALQKEIEQAEPVNSVEVEKLEKPEPVMPTSIQDEPEENIDNEADTPNMVTPMVAQSGESKIDQIANALKLSIAASEEKKIDAINEELNAKVLNTPQVEVTSDNNLEVPSSTSPEAKYLEELAELSKEIDEDAQH